MNPSRREFLKITAAGGAAAAVFGFDLKPAYAQLRNLKIARASETRSTCPYCAVGCGAIIYTIGDRAKNVTPQVVHVEGDPDDPINRGTLCPKGATLKDDINNPNRLLKPKVRRPGSDRWEDISWDEAIQKIARHVKDTRDRTFVAKNAKGQTVNRTPGIAMIGGCTDTNEFNFLQWKFISAIGIPYRDSQARV
jgi:formate dehydrogenase major subunit